MKDKSDNDEKKGDMKNQSVVNVLRLHSYVRWESDEALSVREKRAGQHVRCFFTLTLSELFM